MSYEKNKIDKKKKIKISKKINLKSWIFLFQN